MIINDVGINKFERLTRIALSPISKHLEDEMVTDIMVNGTSVFIQKRGQGKERAAECWDSIDDIYSACESIAIYLKKKIDRKRPILDGTLPGGARINIVANPACDNGIEMTIRKFPKEQLTANDLVAGGSLTTEALQILIDQIKQKKKIIIAGATRTGKTTLLNILASYIPKDDRIITIEDTREIDLGQGRNWSRLKTVDAMVEGENDITMKHLVKASLRMNPDWVICGEVRGEETFYLLRAFNTGHAGMATVHADSSEDALIALENQFYQSGIKMELPFVRQMFASAIDVVVHQVRCADNKIRLNEIAQVAKIRIGNNSLPEYSLNYLYRR
jgi:pilus assembly protein CpaF